MKPEETDIIEDVEVDDLIAEASKLLKKKSDDDKEDVKKDESDEEEVDEAKKVDLKDVDSKDDDDKEVDEAKKVDLKDVDGKDDDDKEDDGDGLDKTGDEDSDIDNDGDSDESDEYLLNRRKKVTKAVSKEKNESVDFVADMKTIAEEDVTLSEEFKEKAGTLFEVALTTRLREETERLNEEFEDRLAEETTKIRESFEEKVDNYLTYAVESWVEDNKIAIEGGLRTEVAESFIEALKHVFVEHYIEVPEAKKDIVSELETKLTEAQEALSAKGEELEALSEEVEKLSREKILAEASESLADTQGARLRALAQDIEFIDESTFAKKVNTIKECYFKGKTEVIEEEEEEDKSSYKTTEVIVEEDESLDLSPTMQTYINALGRINKASSLSGR